jgi:3-phenylpropionate/cinnamic acid dioxygenase small subunit
MVFGYGISVVTLGSMLLPAESLSETDRRELSDVQYFFYREAWLLDHDKLEAWLALLDPGIRYFAPVRSSVNRNDVEGSDAIGYAAHFDDTFGTLSMRVARLRTGKAWAEDPLSRIRRFVSGIVLLGREGESIIVGSNILVHREGADGISHALSAYREDRLMRTPEGSFRLAGRIIWIDHLVVPPLSIIL